MNLFPAAAHRLSPTGPPAGVLDPSLWLIVLLHQCIAMVCLVEFGGPSFWVFSNLLFSIGLYLWLASHDSPASRMVCGLLSGLWMFAGVLLGVAYYSQGQGFSDAFFYHLDPASAAVALRAYPLPSGGVLLLLVLALAWPWLLRPRALGSPVAGMLAGAGVTLALLSCAPAHSLLDYREQLSRQPEKPGPGAAPAVFAGTRPARPQLWPAQVLLPGRKISC